MSFIPKFPIMDGCPIGEACIICNNTAVKCNKKGVIYKATCTWCKQGSNISSSVIEDDGSVGMDGMNKTPDGENMKNGPVGMDGMKKTLPGGVYRIFQYL